MANNHNPQLLLLQSPHQQSQQSQQLHQQPQQPSHYNVAAMRSYAQSPQANSPNGMASTPGPNPPGGHENTTTSDDSDDSTPHTTLVRLFSNLIVKQDDQINALSGWKNKVLVKWMQNRYFFVK